MSNDWWANRIKSENEDLKTLSDKGVNVRVTDKEFSVLNLMALSVGFKNGTELLERFVGDLTGWHTNGSDESHLADQWFDRAFGIWKETHYFFRYFLYNNDVDVEEILEDEDYFLDVYEEYLEEESEKKHESKEDCISILQEIMENKKEGKKLDIF